MVAPLKLQTLLLSVVCILSFGRIPANAYMTVYDDFATGLDTTNWVVSNKAYWRSGAYTYGPAVDIAAGFADSSITTSGYDFALPTLDQVGSSLTVEIKYANTGQWGRWVNVATFSLLQPDDSPYAVVRSTGYNGTWRYWTGNTMASSDVGMAPQPGTQLVRMSVTNVDGKIVGAAFASNDDGLNWTEIYTLPGKSYCPEAVKLRLAEDWGSIWINSVKYETIVPEPPSMQLLASGALALIIRRKKASIRRSYDAVQRLFRFKRSL